MGTANHNVEAECRDFLNRFFDNNPNDTLRKRSLKALRFLSSGDAPLSGKPGGWAAGIIHALANRERKACGIPGLLNEDAENFFEVSMGTVRKRAGQVKELIAI